MALWGSHLLDFSSTYVTIPLQHQWKCKWTFHSYIMKSKWSKWQFLSNTEPPLQILTLRLASLKTMANYTSKDHKKSLNSDQINIAPKTQLIIPSLRRTKNSSWLRKFHHLFLNKDDMIFLSCRLAHSPWKVSLSATSMVCLFPKETSSLS